MDFMEACMEGEGKRVQGLWSYEREWKGVLDELDR